jgi:putative ABC transport system permease protein
MALGAQPSDILRLVIRQGMLPVVIGLGAGLIAAILLTRFMSSLLYGVNAGDTVTLTTSVLLFAVIALIACFVPARRAVKLDPVTALRHE